MAHLMDIIKKGSTDRSVTLRIIDATDGTPEVSVTFETAGIALWYRRQGGLLVAITEATLAALDSAHADGGFLHISDGEYRLDLPDAALATGANWVDVGGTVTGMIVIGGRVRLVDVDLEDAVRGGMTALPNAAAGGAGGLATVDASNYVAGIQGTKNQLDDLNDLAAGAAMALTEAYEAAKTAAQPGDAMDLVDAPNATAVTAIQSGLSTLTAQQVWEYATRVLTAATNLSIPTAADIATAVWGAATRTLSTFGTLAADVWAYTTRILTANTNLSIPAAAPSASDNATAVWSAVTRTLTANTNLSIPAAAPTAAAIADAVLDEALSGHVTAGTAGAALTAAAEGGEATLSAEALAEIREGLALDATLAALKGAGWTDETLKAIYDALAAVTPTGAGAIRVDYIVPGTDGTGYEADVDVWVVSRDQPETSVPLASGRTNQNGQVTFWMDAGDVDFYRQKSGVNFVNPDQRTIS